MDGADVVLLAVEKRRPSSRREVSLTMVRCSLLVACTGGGDLASGDGSSRSSVLLHTVDGVFEVVASKLEFMASSNVSEQVQV